MGVSVIDELIVKLSLDPASFNKNQKKAVEDAKKGVKDFRKQAKDVDDANKSMADGFGAVTRKALALYGLLVGAGSLKEFAVDQINTNAALGRTSKAVEVAVGVLSAWRNIAVINGGTAEGITRSISGLVQEFQNFALTGESSVLPYFRALRVNIADVKTGKMRDINDILLDLAAAGEKLDPAKAAAIFRGMGFDEDTINLLLQGHDTLKKQLDLQKQLGTVTERDTKAAIALQAAWGRLSTAATSFGRNLLTTLAPSLAEILDLMTSLTIGDKRGSLFWKGVGRLADSPFGGGNFEGGLNDVLTSVLGDDSFIAGGGAPAPAAPGGGGNGAASGRRQAAWVASLETERKYGVPAAVTFAQWQVESGGGAHMPAGSNNPFGIKATGNQPGVWAWTNEEINGQMVRVRAKFRAFATLAEAFDAHARLLSRSPAYAAASGLRNDPEAYARAIAGTYASGSGYSAALISAIRAGHPSAGLPPAGAHVAAGGHSRGGGLAVTHIGQVVVNTPHQHAAGIARDIRGALQRSMEAPHANNGQN